MRRSRGSARRYTRRIKTVKYSNETTGFSGVWTITDGAQQNDSVLIAPTSIQGTRKCKNFEISLCGSPWSSEDQSDIPILWALVYVPQGTNPSPLQVPGPGNASSIYEPNQNVIMSGIWPSNITANYKVKTRLARNLNSGDSIYLLFRTAFDIPDGTTKSIVATLNYAIAY